MEHKEEKEISVCCGAEHKIGDLHKYSNLYCSKCGKPFIPQPSESKEEKRETFGSCLLHKGFCKDCKWTESLEEKGEDYKLNENHIMENKETKYIITHRSVMGALANKAVQQSPYPRPDNLEVVLDKFHDLIKEDLDGSIKKYIKEFESWKECHDWIAEKLHTIPEFLLWNERKNGKQGNGFTSAGHHDDGSITIEQAKADNDFIDLDALTRNITNLALND